MGDRDEDENISEGIMCEKRESALDEDGNEIGKIGKVRVLSTSNYSSEIYPSAVGYFNNYLKPLVACNYFHRLISDENSPPGLKPILNLLLPINGQLALPIPGQTVIKACLEIEHSVTGNPRKYSLVARHISDLGWHLVEYVPPFHILTDITEMKDMDPSWPTHYDLPNLQLRFLKTLKSLLAKAPEVEKHVNIICYHPEEHWYDQLKK